MINLRAKEWEARLSGKRQEKFDLFEWADIFMHEYGMNFEDFKKLKIPTFFMLCKKMNKRYEEQAKQSKKLNKLNRRRR